MVVENSNIREAFEQVIMGLSDIKLFAYLNDFGKKFEHQSKFLWNYIKIFELILLFLRGTRQSNWDLHLAALDQFAKYFFAFDQINYAKLTPVYLSQMYALKDSDPETWSFFKDGNFCINKSGIPFTAIGVDHGLEQENKTMKVLGGIQGIANKKNTLDQYFIVAPIVNQLIGDFKAKYLMEKKGRVCHYQLEGTANERLQKNSKKLAKVFENHSTEFGRSSDVFNIMTKAILPVKQAEEFLNHEKIGEDMYKEFKDKRILGNASIWDKMTKRKLPTFVSANKTTKVKLKDRVLELKEERRLMTRFLMASRSREDIDLPEIFGNHEFSVVPRSMFGVDGSLLLGADKSAILHQLEGLLTPAEDDAIDTNSANMTVIFDGMAIVNQLKKDSNIKTCQDLADKFVKNVSFASKDYQEIRMIFDKYQENSLKDLTRHKRTQGNIRRYKVTSDANKEGNTMKMLLSHVLTKRDLTMFLGDALANHLDQLGKRFVFSLSHIYDAHARVTHIL